ncbi:MAG: hypothetical protein HZB39_04230 [Planctomycetes bacterium]|nr:hypothetical protein [Planctomycetota bacterium]
MTKSILALFFAAALGACSLGGYYDREYVLYDSTSGGRDAASRDAATKNTALDSAKQGDPASALPASGAPADPAATQDQGAIDVDVDRIFLLENLLDELGRAIAANVGDAARLQEKRTQVEAEIAWRKTEAGPLYERARSLRIERLGRFPVVLR